MQDSEAATASLAPRDRSGRAAPTPLVLLLGSLSFGTVLLFLIGLHSVFLTFAGLYYVWVVTPTAVCFVYTESRRRVLEGWRRGIRRWWHQLAMSVPLGVGLIGCCLLAYRYLGRWIGIVPQHLRERLVQYGLARASSPYAIPPADIAVILWLSLLNPMMEEFFWRLFLFELLRNPEAGGECRRWWGPAWLVSGLYASYHVPIVASILPAYLAALAFFALTAAGLALQLLAERRGVVMAFGVHAAADMFVCLVLADVVWSLGIEANPVNATAV